MNRRGFLGSILALGVAPAIVRVDSLMRIVPRKTVVFAAGYPMYPYQSEMAKLLWPGVKAWYYGVDYSNNKDYAVGILTAQKHDGTLVVVKDYNFKDLKCPDV